MKGEILTSTPEQDASDGEACLLQALKLARERGLLSLELRVGNQPRKTLGWSSPTRQSPRTSRPGLRPIFGRLSTRDLVAAANLLQQLRSRNGVAKKSAIARLIP